MAAYVVAMIEVHDTETYGEYIEQAPDTVEKYGGTYIGRSPQVHTLEGEDFLGRAVIIKFLSKSDALAWYQSPEYQKVAPTRQTSAQSSFYLIEGIS